MSDFFARKSNSSTLSQWWWMTLALVVFLIIGVTTILLQKELRNNQENRSQAGVLSDSAYVSQGITNLTAGTESFFELNVNTQNQPMDRFYLEFDVLVDAAFLTEVPSSLLPSLTLANPELKFLDSSITPFITPNLANQIGWHVKTGLTAIGFPNTTFSYNLPTPALRFTMTAPKTGSVTVKFDQARTNPYISPSPSPAQVSIPDMIFNVGKIPCLTTYSDWTTCTTPGQQQTRTATVSPATCPAENPVNLTRTCAPQCTYIYSNWTACNNGWQARNYAVDPPSCNWYQAGSLQPLSLQCDEPVSPQDLSAYTYESCWNEQSAGQSTYIIWDKTRFPNVTNLSVSTTSSFTGFANKDITNATNMANNYLATDGTNFRTVSDGKNDLWVFWPGYTYYFRLYYGNNQRTGVISYYVPKCAGVGGVAYKQCNETCTANKDCASNLACVSGQCRRADNATSTICASQPDKGLNRACNEYCADNKECGNGYSCWWNRCRLPQNLENTSCAAVTTKRSQTRTNTTYVIPGSADSAPASITPEMSCNETCRTNRDCAANFRCYLGACRLSDNVASLKCQTLAEDSASSLSGQTLVTPEPIVSIEPVADIQTAAPNWWSGLAEWLAGKLGFVILGLLVTVFVILIWPLLRSSSTKTMPIRPIGQPNTNYQPNPNGPASVNSADLNNLPQTPQAVTSKVNQTPVQQVMTPFQPTKQTDQPPAQPPATPQI